MTKPSELPEAQAESAQSDSVQRLVGLLEAGLEAAEGAQVLSECYFKLQEREPTNNDNYCRLLDWIKDARRALVKQPNVKSSEPAP